MNEELILTLIFGTPVAIIGALAIVALVIMFEDMF